MRPSSPSRLPLRRAPRVTPPDEATLRALLAGSARQVLARIVPGDPLRLRARVARRLRERALFLEADAILMRALALTARAARDRGDREALGDWLDARVDEALADLSDEGAAAGAGVDGAGSALALLAKPLGLPPDAMARACRRFNRQPEPIRQAFFALVVEGRSMEAAATELGCSALEAARRARTGLDVFRAAVGGTQGDGGIPDTHTPRRAPGGSKS